MARIIAYAFWSRRSKQYLGLAQRYADGCGYAEGKKIETETAAHGAAVRIAAPQGNYFCW
jgi:hypothetical protein